MSIAGVGVCQHCQSVVNVHWRRCVVCDQPITVAKDHPLEDPGWKPTASENVQTAFTLNAGPSRNVLPVRAAIYQPGQVVTIHSPMVGVFQAEVLRDNGVVLWVWHPFFKRETAIPNEWVIGEGPAP